MAASSKIKWVELIIIWFNLDKKITLHKNLATFFSYPETSFCTLSLGKDSTRFSSVVFCRILSTIIDNIWSCQNAQWFLGSEAVWIKMPKRTNYKKSRLLHNWQIFEAAIVHSAVIDEHPVFICHRKPWTLFCSLSIEIPVIICHLFHFTFHFAFTQPLGPLCFQVRLPILGFAFNSNFTSGAAPLLGSELCSNQYAKKHKDKKNKKAENGIKWQKELVAILACLLKWPITVFWAIGNLLSNQRFDCLRRKFPKCDKIEDGVILFS